jgi:hypothetical protein
MLRNPGPGPSPTVDPVEASVAAMSSPSVRTFLESGMIIAWLPAI